MIRCGKRCYPSQSAAEGRMSVVKSHLRRERKYEPVRSYWCSRCGSWHLTSTATPGRPVRIRPLRRYQRGPDVPRASADGRWLFVREGTRWFAHFDGAERAYWPGGHLVLKDAVDAAEQAAVSFGGVE